jgi:hypothetical protein
MTQTVATERNKEMAKRKSGEARSKKKQRERKRSE